MSEIQELEKLLQYAKNDLLCNTSYPYDPEFFKKYSSKEDIMSDVEELSLYIHIPFCKSLCKFCEYTRFLLRDEEEEKRYLDLLEKQINEFFLTHNIKKLYGFDIGGGTPSCLSEKGLDRLFEMIADKTDSISRIDHYESSFEFNYESVNQSKIKMLGESGFKRVSSGIQIYDTNIMQIHNRGVSKVDKMQKVNEQFYKAGIQKINLDIMYGFQNQTNKMLDATIEVIKFLDVEQVTLYEMRYNQNGISSGRIDRDLLYEQYIYLYDKLSSLGYKARFGQNTFSKFDDEGVSSYLRNRMKKGIAYKGFGVSAQSMSWKGISYNSLKGCIKQNMPDITELTEQYNYILPIEEIVAKYVSISLYNGCFDLDVISKMTGNDAYFIYKDELEFLLEREYIKLNNRMVYLTEQGFKYYAVVAVLFWSRYHKQKYLERKRMDEI